jgi:hypothetical protein
MVFPLRKWCIASIKLVSQTIAYNASFVFVFLTQKAKKRAGLLPYTFRVVEIPLN